eukprot:CAMPEP_0114273334 /NCGR_PEP_ID=MMETSP0058-20121206/29040_1 /TAXON_ID=36894 /ORGANISM="Pyramimonas parkeae, CCMP726" /LENGTH=167 /DNA_ID=CAMNT_0001392779 /DNA_START=238 /DNA_END=738 /DNA_ORIENTATION=-
MRSAWAENNLGQAHGKFGKASVRQGFGGVAFPGASQGQTGNQNRMRTMSLNAVAAKKLMQGGMPASSGGHVPLRTDGLLGGISHSSAMDVLKADIRELQHVLSRINCMSSAKQSSLAVSVPESRPSTVAGGSRRTSANGAVGAVVQGGGGGGGASRPSSARVLAQGP